MKNARRYFSGKCRCTPDQVTRYRAKISGPLLDRIDLSVEVPALNEQEMTTPSRAETSETVRRRVEDASARQMRRQGKSNHMLTAAEIDMHCVPDAAGAKLLKQAISRLQLSARAYHRVLKIARTIADMADAQAIASMHVAEAVQYRRSLAEA